MSYPKFPGVLLKGSIGNAVKKLQDRLNAQGAGERANGRELRADGRFGTSTRDALMNFQARNEDPWSGAALEVDGIYGPVTHRALCHFDEQPDWRYIETERPDYSDLMTSALKIAMAELEAGAKEEGGNNRGPYVEKYLKSVGLGPGYPWCCAFVYWCVQQAAGESTCPILRTAGVMKLWGDSQIKANKIEHSSVGVIHADEVLGMKTHVPPGSIFIMSYGRGKGHTGFVEDMTFENGTPVLVTVEGNTNKAGSREGDAVYKKVRHVRHGGKIVGFVTF